MEKKVPFIFEQTSGSLETARIKQAGEDVEDALAQLKAATGRYMSLVLSQPWVTTTASLKVFVNAGISDLENHFDQVTEVVRDQLKKMEGK